VDAFLSSLKLCRGGEEVQRVGRREEMLEKTHFLEYDRSRHIKRKKNVGTPNSLSKLATETKIKKFTERT
jgi:hypothetical protein